MWIEGHSRELVWLSLLAGEMTSVWFGMPLRTLRFVLSTPRCFTIFVVKILPRGGIVV